jgi:3D (Asp-Asp-Asp) domain-containing protein
MPPIPTIESVEFLNAITNVDIEIETDEREETSDNDANWRTFEATAYTAFCPSGCNGITATGIDVSNSVYHEGRRVVAVDPTVIPLGALIEVRMADGSITEAIASDTGGAIRGNKIDILRSTRNKAVQFGRQDVEVRIINE